MVMIDAHIHLGSIPDLKGKKWGSFTNYKKIAKRKE